MRKLMALLLCVGMLFGFSGCNFISSEEAGILRAPKPEGEYNEINRALRSSVNSQNFTLKTPRYGEHRSSFIIIDIDMDSIDEAVAFYSQTTDNHETLHMAILDHTDEEWKVTSDTVISGTDVEKVDFGEFTGDNKKEIVVATNIYGSPELRLSLYNIKSSLPIEMYEDSYSDFLVCDMANTGHDNLFVVNSDPVSHEATARLIVANGSSASQISSVAINKNISTIKKLQLSKIDGAPAVFIDAETKDKAYFTDLVYYKGGKLFAPIAKEILTSRYESTLCADIDGDNILEIPTSTILPSSQENALSLTEWHKFTGGNFKLLEYSVISKSGSYKLIIDKKWLGRFTCLYKADDGIDFYEHKDNKLSKRLFSIRSVPHEKFEKSYKDWSVLSESGDMVYAFKIYEKNELGIGKAKIQANTVINP